MPHFRTILVALGMSVLTYISSLQVPGLLENRPSVLRGDHLFVRALSVDGKPESCEYKGYVHDVHEKHVWLGFSERSVNHDTYDSITMLLEAIHFNPSVCCVIIMLIHAFNSCIEWNCWFNFTLIWPYMYEEVCLALFFISFDYLVCTSLLIVHLLR